ncbi:MAG: hypothetical protein EOM23_05945, partial [Candidatus Moranbacteria bacterium]|nr:hypothetical protein [Candidatus Moranbacteria bacterium]
MSEKISGENIKITGETVKDLNGVSDKDLEKEFNIKKIPDMLKGVSETQVSKTGVDESNGVADAKSPLSGNSGNLSWPDVDSNYKGFSDKFVKNLNSIYVSKELPEMLKNYTGKLFRILSDSLSEPVNIKKFVFSETKNGIGQLNNDIHGVIRDITRLKMLDEDKVETLNILKSLIEPTIRNDKKTLISENGVKENADLKSDLKSLFDFVKLNGVAEKQAKEIIAETARVAVYFSHESNSKSYLSSKDAMSNIIGRSTDIMLRKILDSGRFTEAKADFHRNSFKQNEPVQNEKNESFMNQLKKAIAGIFEKASGKKYELNPQGNNLSGKTEFARADRTMEKSIESDVKMQTDTIRKEQATPESQRAENIKEESETVKEAVKNTSVKT